MISHKLKLALLHVPRTGGYSLSEAIKSAYDPDIEFPGGVHGLPEDHEPWLDEYFTVMFVRNPWDRLVSLNHFMTGHGKVVPMDSFMDGCEQCRDAGRGVWMEPSAEPWYSPKVDLVLRFEHLQEHTDHLFELLGKPSPTLPHLHKNENRLPYEAYYETQKMVLQAARLGAWELSRPGSWCLDWADYHF